MRKIIEKNYYLIMLNNHKGFRQQSKQSLNKSFKKLVGKDQKGYIRPY